MVGFDEEHGKDSGYCRHYLAHLPPLLLTPPFSFDVGLVGKSSEKMGNSSVLQWFELSGLEMVSSFMCVCRRATVS